MSILERNKYTRDLQDLEAQYKAVSKSITQNNINGSEAKARYVKIYREMDKVRLKLGMSKLTHADVMELLK